MGCSNIGQLQAQKISTFFSADALRRITVVWGGWVGPVEQAVADSGVEWTRLEPQEFMSNTLTWIDSIRAEGIVRKAT